MAQQYDVSNNNEEQLWYYYKKDKDYGAIGGDNEQCLIQWYHFSCLQMSPSNVSKGKAFKLMDKKGHSGIQDYLSDYEMLAWLVPNLLTLQHLAVAFIALARTAEIADNLLIWVTPLQLSYK